MGTYVFGDVHGCFGELQALLCHIDYRPDRDRLILAGDLINRGPDSLAVLRWARRHNVEMVLGNHDLHLLARAQGINPAFPGDRLDGLFEASDRNELLEWLATRPLLLDLGSHLVVHAGLHPDWDLDQTLTLASAATERLHTHPRFLSRVLAEWRDDIAFAELSEDDTLAQAARILCMVQGCRADRRPVMMKPPPDAIELTPWFRAAGALQRPVCFGHNAALGARHEGLVICVDSGCGYGGPLSAYRLEDGRWFQSRRDAPPWRRSRSVPAGGRNSTRC